MMGYKTRTCYLNFAEHLQNSWNVNFMYDDAPEKWGDEEWDAFFCELAAFGFTNFQFWIPPTMAKASEKRDGYAETLSASSVPFAIIFRVSDDFRLILL